MESKQTDQPTETQQPQDTSTNNVAQTPPDTDKKDEDYFNMGPPRRSPRLAIKAKTKTPLEQPEESDSDIDNGTTTNDDDEMDS